MKRIQISIFLILALAVLYSCQEYEMVQYGAGQQINFMGDYYLGQNKEPYWEDDTAYLHYEVNFGINPLGDSLRVDTVLIGVKISGAMVDYPRKVVFKTDAPDENALEVLFPETYYVPADTGQAVFKILLKRPATRNVTYSANLTFDYAQSDFEAGTLERQFFRLMAEDTVNLGLWGSYEEEWDGYYAMYFGDYSETKARYLITKYGGTSLNEWMMTNQFYDILLSNGFYTDFEAYKADPANQPLIDENTGEWIEIPDISELL